jgi:hypothetical protein
MIGTYSKAIFGNIIGRIWPRMRTSGKDRSLLTRDVEDQDEHLLHASQLVRTQPQYFASQQAPLI